MVLLRELICVVQLMLHTCGVEAVNGVIASRYFDQTIGQNYGLKKPEGSIIHFLFLLTTHNDLSTAKVWRAFFSSASPDSYRVLGHCSDRCNMERVTRSLPQMQLVERVPSSYCTDVVTPMAALLKAALSDAAEPKAMDKFVFLSGSTVPTKPFSVVFRALTQSVKSDICVTNPHNWATATIDGERYRLVKHSQWVVLNKPHAKRFVKIWEANLRQHKQARDARWLINLPSGQGVQRRHFNGAVGSHGGVCTDEEAVFASLFGAVPDIGDIKVASRRFHQLGKVELAGHVPQQGRCLTYVAWETTPGSLAGFIHADEDSDIPAARDKKDYSHPLEMQKLSKRSLSAIRAHPSLFIRKISLDVDLLQYNSVVLSENDTDFSGHNVPVPGHVRWKVPGATQGDLCLDVEDESWALNWSTCSPGSIMSRFWVSEMGTSTIQFGYYLDKCLATSSQNARTGSDITLVDCNDADPIQKNFVIPDSNMREIRWAARPTDCLDASERGLQLSRCSEAAHIQLPRISYSAHEIF